MHHALNTSSQPSTTIKCRWAPTTILWASWIDTGLQKILLNSHQRNSQVIYVENIRVLVNSIGTLAMVRHGRVDHNRSLNRRIKLNLFSFNHVLNLVLQSPTIISAMSWAVGVVSTLSIRIVSRRGSVDVLRRIPQGNQLCFQHVLQGLRQWHVDLRKLSSWRVLVTCVVSLRLC